MTLHSQRLTYTLYTEADFEEYKRQAMDYEIMKYISGKACNEEEAKQKWKMIVTANTMHNVLGYYSVRRIEDNEVAGLAKLVYHGSERGSLEGKENGLVEVGYSLFPEFWGKGYATEITEYLTEFAKTFDDIKEVVGIIHPDNAASKRILTKCGYTLFQTIHSEGKQPSEWYKIKLK
ncbi:MAG: GNAT family N-acetyltransferase [Ignavibacteria bacterium]|nr:GNAT family N-acetyltransferase [Ignavibacteria bacterium]